MKKKLFEVDKKFVTDNLLQIYDSTLKSNNFKRQKGVGITYRRESEYKIDVIEFEIFTPIKCAEWNIPPYSFAVNVGSFYKFIPSFCDQAIAESPLEHPQEFECHFRMRVVKGIWQWGCKDEKIWCIHKNGKNIDRIVKDIDKLIKDRVLPWYSQFENLECVHTDLIVSKNENNKYKKFLKKYKLSFGVSIQIPTFISFYLGKRSEALALAREALISPLFDNNYPKVQHVKLALENVISNIGTEKT